MLRLTNKSYFSYDIISQEKQTNRGDRLVTNLQYAPGMLLALRNHQISIPFTGLKNKVIEKSRILHKNGKIK